MNVNIEEGQKRWEKAYNRHSIGLVLAGVSAGFGILGVDYAVNNNIIPEIIKHGLDYIKSHPVQTAILFGPPAIVSIGVYIMRKTKDWYSNEIWEKHMQYQFEKFEESMKQKIHS